MCLGIPNFPRTLYKLSIGNEYLWSDEFPFFLSYLTKFSNMLLASRKWEKNEQNLSLYSSSILLNQLSTFQQSLKCATIPQPLISPTQNRTSIQTNVPFQREQQRGVVAENDSRENSWILSQQFWLMLIQPDKQLRVCVSVPQLPRSNLSFTTSVECHC